MPKDPLEYLKHIRDECKFILSIRDKGIIQNDFLEDETLKRATVRSLEIIGEAAKKIPVDFREKWSSTNWKATTGMRDRLIHDYMGVNYVIVWDVIQKNIPELYEQICLIIGNS